MIYPAVRNGGAENRLVQAVGEGEECWIPRTRSR